MRATVEICSIDDVPESLQALTDREPSAWVALHAVDTTPGGKLRVYAGRLAGQEVPGPKGRLAAELRVEPGAQVTVWVNDEYEHHLLAQSEGLRLEGVALERGQAGKVGAGHLAVTLRNTGEETGRALLFGGVA